MGPGQTTASIQRYLDQLGGLQGDTPAEPIVRELLERATRRLHTLCAAMLHRSYPRLARPPLNLSSDELLSGVVERMLKALREARPATVRGFFALSNKHMRWELNELARRLDQQLPVELVSDSSFRAPASSGSGLSPDSHRMLAAIEALPEDEREAFSLVRIQGMSNVEAAAVLGVSSKTVQRRITRSLCMLAEALDDLRPRPPGSARQAGT
jgi:RNA polymerase sigma-70 factor (ECF subfamily)